MADGELVESQHVQNSGRNETNQNELGVH